MLWVAVARGRPPGAFGCARTGEERAVARYRIGVNGQLEGEYADSEKAFAAALEKKRRNPTQRITIYDTSTKVHFPVELPEE